MDFGNTLKRIREEKGLTQEDLANLIGKSRATISKLESGIRTPDIPIIETISKALNVSVSVLYLGNSESFTYHEQKLIEAYRNQPPAVQDAIDRLLGVEKKFLPSAKVGS